MRRSTSASRCRVRRSTVAKRNSIHSRRMVSRFFCCGLPSVPTIVRLIETLASRLVWASSTAMNSSCARREDLGSRTMRTGASSLDSSRTESSTPSTRVLRFFCSCETSFLPARGCGLVSASISESTLAVDTPCGSSVTITRHWPRASSSTFQRARMRTLPRPSA